MAVHATVYLILCLLLTACGPQLQRPPVSRELVERERELQKETALRVHMERLEQLNRVSTLLAIRAAEFCENRLEPWIGAMWTAKDSFPEDTKAVAARMFKLDGENLRIVSVIPGRAAANAGLKPGDTILKINGNEIIPPATFSSTPISEKARDIIRKAGSDPLQIEIHREGEIKSILVTPEVGCGYPVGLSINGTVNAFTDGQKIGITTGMLRFIKGDDELALILGHELAHNILDHVNRTRGNQLVGGFFGILLDVGMAAAGVNTGGAFTRAAMNTASLVYSKDFEMESDYLGLYLAARAGFDISHAPDFFRRMAVEHPATMKENFLSTHPSSPERSAGMEATVKEIRDKIQAEEALTPRRIEVPVAGSKSKEFDNPKRERERGD
jgi:hypothetical protein